MQAYKLTDDIYWVGAIDWKLRNFHGYKTDRGSTYNAYLILDDKVTLIDTVKSEYADEMLERIRSVIPLEKIDIIVSNHVEPDHSGALPALVKYCPQAEIVTSFPAGVKGLKAYYGDMNYRPVKSGEELCLGKRTLKFLATPMVHWPDNMVTYIETDGLLFSNDAFGAHYAASGRLDTQVDLDVLKQETRKYYANIVLPYSSQVKGVLKALEGLNLKIIAPSHGAIWTEHIPDVIDMYTEMSGGVYKDKAVVVYDTMWKSTERIATAIAEAYIEAGVEVKLFDLKANHESDIIVDIMDAKFVAVGSPTLNNNMMQTVAKFLCYIKGLTNGGKKYVAFGSYGWGGQSVQQVEQELIACKYEKGCDNIKILYRPTGERLKEAADMIKSMLG